jgi:MFS family permease
MRYLLRTMLT